MSGRLKVFEETLEEIVSALEQGLPTTIKFRDREVIVLSNAENVEKAKRILNDFRIGKLSFKAALESF